MSVTCTYITRPKLPRNKYGTETANYTTVSGISNYYGGSSSSSSSGGNYTVFNGATASSPGTAGLVPAPSAGSENYFLKGNGTWSYVSAGGDVSGLEAYTYASYAYSLDQIYTSAFVSGQIDAYLNCKIDDNYTYFTNIINNLISRIEALENRT